MGRSFAFQAPVLITDLRNINYTVHQKAARKTGRAPKKENQVNG